MLESLCNTFRDRGLRLALPITHRHLPNLLPLPPATPSPVYLMFLILIFPLFQLIFPRSPVPLLLFLFSSFYLAHFSCISSFYFLCLNFHDFISSLTPSYFFPFLFGSLFSSYSPFPSHFNHPTLPDYLLSIFFA